MNFKELQHCYSLHVFLIMAAPPYRNPNWIIPQLVILGGTECLVCLFCVLYLLYNYRANSSMKSIPSSLKWMNICGVSSFLLCGIMQCINIWYWNVYYTEYSVIQTITWYSTWLFWTIGIFMTYLLFLYRIRTTFRDSSLEPSRCTLYSLYLLLSLYMILSLTVFILPLFIYMEGSGLSREELFDLQWTLSVPLAVLEIVTSISMIWIFVSRLRSLILKQSSHSPDEFAGSEYSLKERRQRLLVLRGIKVKIAILALVSLTSSSILMGFRVASFYLSYKSPMAKVAAIWLQFDTMLSCVCLVLFHSQTQRYFNILCCCCSKVVSIFMKESLQNSRILEIHTIEDTCTQEIVLEESNTENTPKAQMTPNSEMSLNAGTPIYDRTE